MDDVAQIKELVAAQFRSLAWGGGAPGAAADRR